MDATQTVVQPAKTREIREQTVWLKGCYRCIFHVDTTWVSLETGRTLYHTATLRTREEAEQWIKWC